MTAEVWRDPAVPAAERVSDLISRMTLREKVAQLYGVWVGIDDTDGEMAPHQHELAAPPADWEALIRDGIGQLTRAFGTRPVEPSAGARAVAQTQRQIMAAGRFGIPAVVHEEILTGLAAWRATIYPSPLCWGASFDPALVERMGAQIGRTARRLGVHQGLAPVLDVVRDPRWGRVEETIGEDPFLVGVIGSAYVRGVESAGVVATLKHFAGHSASRGGRNMAPVSIGPRELADVMLPPFEMALRAGVRSVMNAYVDLDGVPAAADAALLTDLLRGTYGFTGTVVADYFAVTFLETLHNVAGSPGEAAALALKAGIDVELPTVSCYGQPLLDAIEAGQVDLATVDGALERVLRQKCELGLLDADWSPEPEVLVDGDADIDPAQSRALARELAQRSIVLLRNEGGALPLAPGRRIALVGPRAHEAGAMLGCYSFPLHVGVNHPDVPMGVEVPTLLEALRDDAAGYQVSYAQGVPVLGGDDAGIDEAVRAAREAEVCVAVLGDRAGLFGAGTSGEGCDATDLRLPGRQEELLEALLATGTPVVLVLLVGRPYELSRQAARLAAIVCGFFPGEEGAHALADVLGGRVNPTGRLPIGFPAAGTNQPSTYLAAPLGYSSDVSSVEQAALFPFGHGLSYAPATWGEVALSDSRAQWPTDGTCTLTVTLHNDAQSATSEVVQVYLHDPVAEVVRPVQRLIAAPRIDLAPGEART
ncbi:MAG TPA: glycoside hydrolase family 3 N-terminal domain-containing protein, partial [Thermoleophilia bacterium]|nr:glycoside hydrolase family 3 N-terminal domain-containing protein [Thermoleophilia bacterium]